MPSRRRRQLAIQVPDDLPERVRAAAAAQKRTATSLLLEWIEAGLAGAPAAGAPAGDLLARIEALEVAVAALPRPAPAPPRVDAPPAPNRPAPRPAVPPPDAPAGAITTAELAERTSTNRAAWNNWARSDRIGAIREHSTAGRWRLAGQAAPATGGPPRWVWQQEA